MVKILITTKGNCLCCPRHSDRSIFYQNDPLNHAFKGIKYQFVTGESDCLDCDIEVTVDDPNAFIEHILEQVEISNGMKQ